ncbi:hypothetical protein CgunFtcFv8_023567 [Champsocephalus gunnari]|uniref:Uncharacterized protein n=1 Tax=Champsocephalus gunnari TaxID=52237 RepID=A0AAN8DGJ4_CHAGU|nr:hypothetical protein CgunFtcFv8_023567 [Champsocephalus gunnari]
MNVRPRLLVHHGACLQTDLPPRTPTDGQGAGDAAISPLPAWSWGGSLTATPDALAAGGLQCLLTGLQGLLLHHRGGQLIHRLPCRE